MTNNQKDFDAQFTPIKLENCDLEISELIGGDYNDVVVSIRGQIINIGNGVIHMYDGTTPYLLPVIISPYFHNPDGLICWIFQNFKKEIK